MGRKDSGGEERLLGALEKDGKGLRELGEYGWHRVRENEQEKPESKHVQRSHEENVMRKLIRRGSSKTSALPHSRRFCRASFFDNRALPTGVSVEQWITVRRKRHIMSA